VLILGTDAHVDKLVAFYAIGVFTGFTLAGFGMARYFTTHRDGRWRAKVVVNTLVGAVAGAVVLIFAVTKFTEGAWLVVLVFPVMVVLLLRLRRTYQEEDALLRALPQRESRPLHGVRRVRNGAEDPIGGADQLRPQLLGPGTRSSCSSTGWISPPSGR
jgi:K+ transporter